MFINEPRLSDFKQVLLREGIQAEFVGGVLVCNNMVAVRRVSISPPRALQACYPSALHNIRQALHIESGQKKHQFVFDQKPSTQNVELLILFNTQSYLGVSVR